ncbi:AAA family ATPase [Vibrio campbellii]|uniref:AAA family ATPase n=1 Tax=Vibrio campbellii TaxID=680 RepID=UPI00168D5F73|nr:AAA family ATPase [Vibrio campbellii]
MYKVKNVKISGFWGEHTLNADFDNDVNVIIGRNGTGKTTFMNILHAVLTVDVDWLDDFEFNLVEIKLTDKNRTKTIKVFKDQQEDYRFQTVQYSISNKKYVLRVANSNESLPLHFKRRLIEESEVLRDLLRELVNITTLSVYRIKKEYELERRERMERKLISPVDQILTDLLTRLASYNLELSDQARGVSSKLQREVLTSLLYSDKPSQRDGIKLEFNKKEEKRKLITAYRQLGVLDAKVRKDINLHIERVAASIDKMKEAIGSSKDDEPVAFDFGPLEKIRQTNDVVRMSLQAEVQEKEIFRQREIFLKTLKGFIEDKDFEFVNGVLKVYKEREVPVEKLSSGEKQLIILFAESLLQREKPFVFIADEPELSLHVSWQREILPAIRLLNPNSQLIVATHSPEVAGKYFDKLVDMEDILK